MGSAASKLRLYGVAMFTPDARLHAVVSDPEARYGAKLSTLCGARGFMEITKSHGASIADVTCGKCLEAVR